MRGMSMSNPPTGGKLSWMDRGDFLAAVAVDAMEEKISTGPP